MADFLNDPIGSKYGCSYRYTNGVLGTFGALLNEPVNPKKSFNMDIIFKNI